MTLHGAGSCASGQGIVVELKFAIPGDPGKFVPLYETCVDQKNANVFYSTHIIRGASIKKPMKKPSRDPFWNPEFYNQNVEINKCYQEQKERVAALLGVAPDHLDKKFFDEKDDKKGFYFNRGHLNPNGDQIFRTWRDDTYYFINTVPQWRIVNEGGIGNLENVVRDRADRLNGDLKVITGGFELYRYQDRNFFLSSDHTKVPIPKWIYKVVEDPKTNQMIAFVVLNDPHRTVAPTSAELPCKDLYTTTRIRWNIKDRIKVGNGYTIACKVADLKVRVPFLPINDSGKLLN